MEAAERGRLAVDRALVGEQLAGLAPVDDLGRAPQPGHPAAAERDGRDLPGERLRGRGDADVDDPLIRGRGGRSARRSQQPLARPQLELAQVDRGPAQPHAVAADLSDPTDADEHPPALDGDDEPVDAWAAGRRGR